MNIENRANDEVKVGDITPGVRVFTGRIYGCKDWLFLKTCYGIVSLNNLDRVWNENNVYIQDFRAVDIDITVTHAKGKSDCCLGDDMLEEDLGCDY
jgi:hypothetical protein